MKKKIVITPLFGMGDVIMTTPALEVLKRNYQDCEITFFTFSTLTYEILRNNPFIDNLWYKPIKVKYFFKDIFHIVKNFTFKFNYCINFYPSNRVAYNIFSLITGAKYRIGHTYLNKNFSQLNWLKNKKIKEDFTVHCVEENIRLLKFFDITIPSKEIPPTKIFLTDSEKSTGISVRKSFPKGTVVGVHTGTSTFKGQANRRWPKEKFVQLIDLVPDVHFVLFGQLDELEVNKFIQCSVKNSNQVTIVENTPIRETAAIIGQLNGFVSNDSGLMHVAAAMNTPVVAILGPTNQNYIHPWYTKHRVVRLDLPCSPCFYYSPRPLRCSLNNSFKCVKELPASDVACALKEILDNKK